MHFAGEEPDYIEQHFFVNPTLAASTYEVFLNEDFFDIKTDPSTSAALELMDLVNAQSPGKTIMVGLRYVDSLRSYEWLPDQETVNNNKVLALVRSVFEHDFKTIHGVVYGTQVRRLPTIPHARWGLVLRWQTAKKSNYGMKMVKPSSALVFRGDHMLFSVLMAYSFDHVD